MDVDARPSSCNGKVSNGGYFHSVQHDTIREGLDTHEIVRRRSLSDVDELAAEEEVNGSKPSPYLDRGYGWVVVMASFFVAFIVDGVGSSFGLLFPHILLRYDASAFVASFAGSLFVAFLIMGSISAELVQRFGFRTVTVAGSVLSCVAFVVAAFSENIYIFIVTYGLLAGCSCGLVFIPSIIIVNEYFHVKRGIANGIISSGSGVGLLVLAPVINLWLETYLLSGTVLLLAGVLLNMCVFSCLFRPPPNSLKHPPNACCSQPSVESLSSNLSSESGGNFTWAEMSEAKDGKGVPEHRARVNFDIDEILARCRQTYLNKSLNGPVGQGEESLHGPVGQGEESLHGPVGQGEESLHGSVGQGEESLHGSVGQRESDSKLYVEYMLSHLRPGVSHGCMPHEHWRSSPHLDSTNVQQVPKHPRVHSMCDIPACSRAKEDSHHRTFVRGPKHLHHLSYQKARRHSRPQNLSFDHGSSFYLAGSITTLVNLHNSFLETLQDSDTRELLSSCNVNRGLHQSLALSEDCKMNSEHLLKQHSSSKSQDVGGLDKLGSNNGGDLFQSSRSMANHGGDLFQSSRSMATHGGDLFQSSRSMANHGGVLYQSSRSMAKSGYSILAGEDVPPDVEPLGYTMSQLLCIPAFHLFCVGASLIQIGYPLAGTFLANYAYQFGLTTAHTAVLMSLLGGLNICGRLLAGALVSLKVDPLLLNNVSLLLGGAACLLSPLYREFWSLCLFASMFGFFLGFFPPLQPLIIVKHFGLESLASAFGVLSTAKGVASILGAPLAGWIYDVTGQYSMSFMFGGAVFVLSSLVHCFMACASRCRNGSCKTIAVDIGQKI